VNFFGGEVLQSTDIVRKFGLSVSRLRVEASVDHLFGFFGFFGLVLRLSASLVRLVS